MELYRLSVANYADLSGKGGLYGGGRWHEKGTLACYTASSRSLAAIERLVHESVDLMPKLVMMTIWIPDDVSIQRLTVTQLPKDWDSFPDSGSARKVGGEFFTRGENLLLQVPSAIISEEFNYLLNPTHPDATKAKIVELRDYYYDKRLEKMIR